MDHRHAAPAKKPLSVTGKRVLELLREDGRRTVSDMAARLGVSRPTVSYHMDQLRAHGYIRRFTIEPGPAAADTGPPGFRAMFDLKLRRNASAHVIDAISGWDELCGAWSVAGEADLRVLIVCGDQDRVEELRNRLARHPEVVSLTTTAILRTWCERPPQLPPDGSGA